LDSIATAGLWQIKGHGDGDLNYPHRSSTAEASKRVGVDIG
jgi:hypothetical protein